MRVQTMRAPLSLFSPLRVLALVLSVIFVVEGSIMGLVAILPPDRVGPVWIGAADAALLTLVVSPVIWFLVVLPTRKLYEERGRILQRILESQEQERSRVALDLHDSIGQQLTAILVSLGSIDALDDLDKARARVREIRSLGVTAIEDVRRLAHGLRPVALEDLGLNAALERLCLEFERTYDLAASVTSNLTRRLDPVVETTVYRIVQESMSNAARHGAARNITVEINDDGGKLAVSVRDDGSGFDPREPLSPRPGSGMGLRGIRQRLSLLQGEMQIVSEPGAGTTLSFVLRAGN